jgi:hypothetical protein
MNHPLAQFRKIVPWYIKFGIKIVRGLVPINYNLFASLGFFRHGKMDDPKYAISVFNKHFPDKNEIPNSPFVFLEIGPGDSLFSGIIASHKGASKSYLIDSGVYVSKDIRKYLELIELLFGTEFLNKHTITNIEDIKKTFHIEQMIHGLDSLKSLSDHSVDLSFSNACLEHVAKDEVEAFFIELKRVSRPGSISSHCIDFKDHLSYSLNNLRFSEKFWEKDIIKKSGIYTNRVRYSEMKKASEKAGFHFVLTGLDKWPMLPMPKSQMHQDFQQFLDDDLLVKEAWIKLR